MRRVAVVGGGISGLVAAYRLRRLLGADLSLTIFDPAIGGKLHTVELAGEPLDVGAEAFVGRRPEVPALLAELGLSDQLVRPAGLRPLLWAGGRAHPLPGRTLMGIPSAGADVAGLVTDASRVDAEVDAPQWDSGDVSVADLVAPRFGADVVARSVDPLLGGVYSGTAETIGVRAALPTLAAALDAGAPTLRDAVATALPPPSTAPVFGALRDGYRALTAALLAASGADVVGEKVTRLDELADYDGVVVAVPAPVAARLLDFVPVIPVASSAVVALAFSPDVRLPEHSGVLVATGEALQAKAFTFSSRKWSHLGHRSVVRASFGRYGAPPDSSDTTLIAGARADLETVAGVAAEPIDAVVMRWPEGLPQYRPGHLDVVAAIEAAAARVDRLEVAGSYLRGVGVPACVASGDAAAQRLARAMAR